MKALSPHYTSQASLKAPGCLAFVLSLFSVLNGSRKILTLVTLERIEQKLDDCTMTWQGVYKHGKSCADIVWAQRMMISDVSRKPWSYHKMGLDMSRAFDTVKRDTIVNLFRES